MSGPAYLCLPPVHLFRPFLASNARPPGQGERVIYVNFSMI